jgi:hypothetical protein
MNVSIKNIKEKDCACDALILPFTEGDARLYKNLDQATLRLVKRVFSKEFHGKLNETLLIPAPENIKPENPPCRPGKRRYLGREGAAGRRKSSYVFAR